MYDESPIIEQQFFGQPKFYITNFNDSDVGSVPPQFEDLDEFRNDAEVITNK